MGIDKKIESRFDGEYQGIVEKIKSDMAQSNNEASDQRASIDNQSFAIAKNQKIATASIQSANNLNKANIEAIIELQKLMNSRKCCCEYHNRG